MHGVNLIAMRSRSPNLQSDFQIACIGTAEDDRNHWSMLRWHSVAEVSSHWDRFPNFMMGLCIFIDISIYTICIQLNLFEPANTAKCVCVRRRWDLSSSKLFAWCCCSSEPASLCSHRQWMWLMHTRAHESTNTCARYEQNQFLPFMVINCDDVAASVCLFHCIERAFVGCGCVRLKVYSL